MLNWQWPLISLEWLPEIIGSLCNLLEPSWVGLQREMIANVTNQSFGKKIFSQLQILLLETELIREDGRFLQSPIKPTRQEVCKHLTTLFENSYEPWANYYRKIASDGIKLNITATEGIRDSNWVKINHYPVFKQWADFFQFIGLGFFIGGEIFIPESAITPQMLEDKLLAEKFIKANKDPRILSGHYSLHTEADFFTWSKGEDKLSISSDQNLTPRIPHEIITADSNNSIREKLNEGILYWEQQVKHASQEYITFDLEQLIITHKIFIDYFLFGQRSYDLEFIAKDKLHTIKNKWATVPNFSLSENTWKALPKIYNNITRLNFSVLYYRNSLQRVVNPWSLYNENLLYKQSSNAIKKIPIRSFRTKRHLGSFLDNIFMISTSIARLKETKTINNYKEYVSARYTETVNFLPSDPIETKSILTETAKFIAIDHKEISTLKQRLPRNFISDCPIHDNLASCYWIHRKDEIINHPKAITVRSINEKLKNLEKKYRLDMDYFEHDMTKWDDACNLIQESLNKHTPLL